MKKILASALACTMAVSMAVPVLANDGITVVVNGKTVDFADQKPIIKNDRTLIPLRGVLEEMGASVNWYDYDKSAFATRGISYAGFKIGSDVLITSEGETKLDVAPEIINDRTMIPLRAVAESFGADVQWDGNTKTVTITDSEKVLSADTETISEEYKGKDGTVIATVDFDYPVLNGRVNAPGRDAASETIKSILLSDYNESMEIMNNSAEDYYAAVKEYGGTFSPLYITGDYEITYISKDIVSLCSDVMLYTGGAHPTTTRECITIDLNTGKKLELSDIVDGDTNKLIKDAYTAAIKADPEKFYPEALTALDDSISNIDFCLKDGAIEFVAQQYEVAPYAAGFVTVDVPADSLGNSLKISL